MVELVSLGGDHQIVACEATGIDLVVIEIPVGIPTHSPGTHHSQMFEQGLYSMLVEDGVVRQLNREAPGKFEVSDAGTLLKQL